MVLLLELIYFVTFFLIFWAMIGYPISLIILNKILKPSDNEKKINNAPTVTIMIVAHNEEKVIKEKLLNVIKLEYPREKIKILIASDNSTDKTNEIVKEFIETHKDHDIRLFKSKNRMGKTNAQNEAQKTVETEFLVMTDANSLIESTAIGELMASFSSDNIAYVCGILKYTNNNSTQTTKTESTYWDLDVKLRYIESKFQTITAGNGALYAVRNSEYVAFDPIESHDSAMPTYYNLKNKRAIMNIDAVVFEKAGETISDEFARKVRMNRNILKYIMPKFNIFNFIKYKWYSFFYFGHRTCRYLLWLSHTLLLLSNVMLVDENMFFLLSFIGQTIVISVTVLNHFFKMENRYINLVYYYLLTVFAQLNGVFNILRGKAKPFWEKAESTR